MDNLTKTAGVYIRDILRTDTTFLSLIGLTTANAKNHIFFGIPTNQVKGFANPRLNVIPLTSDADELSYTGIFQGLERFKINLYVNDRIGDDTYSTVMDCLDRIVTLFNKTSYSITNNVGEFEATGKISFKDPDKESTDKGELNITLKIGGL